MSAGTIDPNLKSHFLNLYSIALSDLEVETTELELLYKLGEQRGISKDEINNVIINPNSFKIKVPETLEEKIEFLYEFALMIWVDGKVDEFERNAMIRFCRIFGFVDESILEIADFLLEEAKKGTSRSDLLNLATKNV